jgi:hypothetical protein
MSEIKVNSIKGVGASAAAITVNNTDGTCTANITNRSNKNLIINGAMQVAQRGTSSTTNGYGSVDRVRLSYNSSGLDEVPTQAHADVASGTTPYTLGFRKSFKITNGNQTSGAGAGDFIKFQHRIEAQNIANSGWNYTSSSSYITLSFWVKSSVAQNFYGYLETFDGSGYLYPFETGSLSADTWTKVTKTISGNSNLTFNNDNGSGLQVEIQAFMGTDSTASGVSLNQWNAYAAGSRTPDQTSTWFTTNDATFEITGVQLEVSDYATLFEHRSYGQELALCQRYYYTPLDGNSNDPIASGTMSYGVRAIVHFPVKMRNPPSIVASNFTDAYYYQQGGNTDFFDTMTLSTVSTTTARIQADGNVSNPSDGVGILMAAESTSAVLGFNAEL